MTVLFVPEKGVGKLAHTLHLSNSLEVSRDVREK